jgi:putative ubiquitin-RnfH superfamily antitoxin RatB of RatAB toxin-antitoxin module
MALKGKIEEFPVHEVLQFVALHEGDGVLIFRNKNEEISFGFISGKIAGAIYGKEDFFKPLEEYIINSGKLSSEELKRFKSMSKGENRSIDEILIEENIITMDEIKSIIKFKIQEIVDEVLTWKEGSYSFHPGQQLYKNRKIDILLEPNALLMEGTRRIDEWPRIKEVLGDPEITIFSTDKKRTDVEIGVEENRILEIHKDGMKVKDYIEKSGLGKFRTYNALFNLIELGILRKEEKEKEEIEEEEREKIKIDFRKVLNVLEIIIFVLFILIDTFFLFKFKMGIILKLFKRLFSL